MLNISTAAFRTVKYINYWLSSTDEHSLHAPFSYDFYTNVVKNRDSLAGADKIENLRRILHDDHSLVAVTDYGAGSSSNASKTKSISNIVKSSLTPQKYSLIYNKIIDFSGATRILELGTSLGLNTMYLANGQSVEHITTMEGCPQIAALAMKNFKALGYNKVHCAVGRIDSILETELNRLGRVDFVLFDANHTYTATLDYFEKCLTVSHEASVFVFDDIYWSPDMCRAWEEIKRDKRVTLSLDLYRSGIVFFKKNIVNEHLVLMI